jgi:hypothetical protein
MALAKAVETAASGRCLSGSHAVAPTRKQPPGEESFAAGGEGDYL